VTDEILGYLRETVGPWSYLVLALCALIEYVVPPFPGDTVVLFGSFLSATAGLNGVVVYLSVTAGSTLGGVLAYRFGRTIGDREERWPRFMRGEGVRRALESVRKRFERHGPTYLVINRFVPGLRSVVFVGAGLSKVPEWQVVVYGGLSAAAWNAAIFGVGYAIGYQWDRLDAFLTSYTRYAVVLVGVIVVLLLVRLWWRRTHQGGST